MYEIFFLVCSQDDKGINFLFRYSDQLMNARDIYNIDDAYQVFVSVGYCNDNICYFYAR